MNRRSILVVAVAVVCASALTAQADPYTFGLISDTQDTIGTGVSTVPTNIVKAVNRQFIATGVSFVLEPGDLCDDGSAAGEAERLAINSDPSANLTAAGIPFYALRGNHDDTSGGFSYFQANYIPANTANQKVEVASYDNMTYAVTVNNTKFVMLDIDTADTTANMDSATTWMNTVLGENDHTQAFVLQHKNLIGQNHHDDAFQTGSNQDANPTQQNNFYRTLATNNVKYDICGHDHMNHRSICTSPDGQNQVQEIISQSDSTKFYTPAAPYDSREQVVSDQQNMLGYYTYTVDGPRVTGKYYATAPVNNDIPANPVWTLQDTFGYSLNGKQFTVARGASYNAVRDAIAAGSDSYSGGMFKGTSMHLSGTNSVTGTAGGSRAEVDDVNTGWAVGTNGMISDILTIWGMNNALGADTTDPYSLTLSYIGNVANPVIEHQNADGTWTLLNTVNNGDGTVTASGLTFVGNFAVTPEPATMALLALGGLALIRRRNA